MTLEEFRDLAGLQDFRVRLVFSDGQVVIAKLLSISTDLDDSRHVIYEDVEWSSPPIPDAEGKVFYAPGEELCSCIACVAD
jgi:hypothetical protein